MFNLFGKKKAPEGRSLSHFKELQVKDLVTFKPRNIVPDELQDQTLTVTAVQSYQYDDGISAEFVLALPNGNTFTAMCSNDEEGDTVTLSKKLSHECVNELFDGDELGNVFSDEESASLTVINEESSEEGKGWLAERYFRTVYLATAYFYKEDRRLLGASEFADDGSEELRYHELEGGSDEYSLNIEIWESGETDFFLQKTIPHNAISDLWPNG